MPKVTHDYSSIVEEIVSGLEESLKERARPVISRAISEAASSFEGSNVIVKGKNVRFNFNQFIDSFMTKLRASLNGKQIELNPSTLFTTSKGSINLNLEKYINLDEKSLINKVQEFSDVFEKSLNPRDAQKFASAYISALVRGLDIDKYKSKIEDLLGDPKQSGFTPTQFNNLKKGASNYIESQRIAEESISKMFEEIPDLTRYIETSSEEFLNLSEKVEKLSGEVQTLKERFDTIGNTDAFKDLGQDVDNLKKSLGDVKDIVDGLGDSELLKGIGDRIKSLEDIIDGFNSKTNTEKKGAAVSNSLEKLFRGTFGLKDFINEHGESWFSDDLIVANSYNRGAIYSSDVDTSKFYKMDANGAHRSSITWLGDGTDETSKRMIYLRDRIAEVNSELDNIRNNHSIDGLIDSNYEGQFNKLSEELKSISSEYRALDNSKENMYGTHDIKWFQEQAKSLGYLGIQIQKVNDLNNGLDNKESRLSNVFSVFDHNLISNVHDVTEEVKLAKGETESLLELSNKIKTSNVGTAVTPIIMTDEERRTSEIDEEIEYYKTKYEQLLTTIRTQQEGISKEVNKGNLAKIEEIIPKFGDDVVKEFQQIKERVNSLDGEGTAAKEAAKAERELADARRESNASSPDKTPISSEDQTSELQRQITAAENLVEQEEKLNAVRTEAKSPYNQQDIIDAINDEIKANEKLAETKKEVNNIPPVDTSDTVKNIDKENETVKETKEAFTEAAAAKEKFAKANQEASDSAEATAKNNANKTEAKQINELLNLLKNIKKIKSDINYANVDIVNNKNVNTATGAVLDLEEKLSEAEDKAKKLFDTLSKSKSISIGKRNEISKAFDNAFNYKGSAKSLGALDDARAKVAKANQEAQIAAQKRELELLEETKKKIQEETDARAKAAKKNEEYTNRLNNNLKEYANRLNEINKLALSAKDVELFGAINDYIKLINDISKKNNGVYSDADKQNIANYEKEIRKLLNTLKQGSASGFQKIIAKTQSALNEMSGASVQTRAALKGLLDEMRYFKGNITPDVAREFNKRLAQITGNAKEAGENVKSLWDRISQRVSLKTADAIARYLSPYDLLRYGKQIVGIVTEIDTALTELRKVSDASTSRLNESFRTSADTAKELGATITDVINSTSDWSRLGYSVDQAEELARLTTLFQNVGDNMTQESASQSLVSTLQGFQLGVDQAEEIINKYNSVANNFAIDTAGIGEALQRSAASFNAANTDLSKSIALITATNEVVQNPESVGRCANLYSNI